MGIAHFIRDYLYCFKSRFEIDCTYLGNVKMYYVSQHGMKFSEVNELSRTQLEEGADFLGLIIMQNLVKKETYGAITELHAADIVTLMVKGDNIQTAIR